ncbi:MAG TPA: helix-turn-helix domain-containing protein [Solirubrobacteraceae bacterium]|jgi:DNA-binding HxlR family transcriptional regulator|nr:helix-turn-helix domain-containing protein [Solirubrobacteraceae bacterium]
MRSYDEYCALAKSLDVIGDRWTLLIVRELELRGACRYTDLRNGLPGIATNLLADRLRELEHEGVVAREEAPPPIATTLFRLTPRGTELRPVLESLVRWGMPFMTEENAGDAVRSHWLAWAIELILTDRRPDAAPVTIELRAGDQPFVLETRDGKVVTRVGPAGDAGADATITGEPRPVMGLLLGILGVREAKAAGVSYVGDRAILDRIGADPALAGAAGAPS